MMNEKSAIIIKDIDTSHVAGRKIAPHGSILIEKAAGVRMRFKNRQPSNKRGYLIFRLLATPRYCGSGYGGMKCWRAKDNFAWRCI